VLHGWEMTGDEVYWHRMMSQYIDALASHQVHPPDGHPAERLVAAELGALRSERNAALRVVASPWMTAICSRLSFTTGERPATNAFREW